MESDNAFFLLLTVAHLGGTGLSGQAEGALEALLVLVGDPALGDADVQPLPDHGYGHAVPVLHLLTADPGQQHRGVDTLLIRVGEQDLNLVKVYHQVVTTKI